MINDSTISAHLIKKIIISLIIIIIFFTFNVHSNLLHLACYFLIRPSVDDLYRLWVNVLSFLISYILTNKIYTTWLSNSYLVYIYLLKIIISERKKRTEPRGGLLMYTMYALLWIIFILSCVLFLISICCRFLKSDQFNYKFIQWFTLLKSIYRLPINTF